ncbi:hypothetical protein AeMF1_020114 [Aphanomyces euteiches]|nr:hypothetical protein AeMF1_020114 [Aphanomyces euteiches]
MFKCNRRTILCIWSRGRASHHDGHGPADVTSKIRGNCGKKKMWTQARVEAAIKAVSLYKRQTLRTLAIATNISAATLHRHMKTCPRFKARTSYVKPLLTEANMMARLKHALSFLEPLPSGNQSFVDMHNYVHVDEKWFYLEKVKRRFYVYDDEDLPSRRAKSKRVITKVMFVAAVARPRFDHHTKKYFDGKLGVWPFVEKIPAKRGSKNRPRGAIVTSPQIVDSKVYADAILTKVVPAIKSKFPASDQHKGVIIQQDNAGPHMRVTTELLLANGIEGIQVANQPPNSPDFNILDLGFFNAIQSLQYQKHTRSIDELIGAVEAALLELPVDTLAKTFVTLQKVLEI